MNGENGEIGVGKSMGFKRAILKFVIITTMVNHGV
jgi:hypothetical protein